MSVAEDIRNLFREFGGHPESYVEFNNMPSRAPRGVSTIETAWNAKHVGESRGGHPGGPEPVRRDTSAQDPSTDPVLTRFSGRSTDV